MNYTILSTKGGTLNGQARGQYLQGALGGALEAQAGFLGSPAGLGEGRGMVQPRRNLLGELRSVGHAEPASGLAEAVGQVAHGVGVGAEKDGFAEAGRL